VILEVLQALPARLTVRRIKAKLQEFGENIHSPTALAVIEARKGTHDAHDIWKAVKPTSARPIHA
jgi:hypothetical protein